MNVLFIPWGNLRRPTGDQVLVFASRNEARRPVRAARILSQTVSIYWAANRAPGCLGATMLARPVHGSYYTLSRWQDEASLMAFAHGKVHRRAAKVLNARSARDGVLMSWWVAADAPRPSWAEGVARTEAEPVGPYRGPCNQPAEPAAAPSSATSQSAA